MPSFVRVTPQNSHQFVGHDICFRTRGKFVYLQILEVTNSGKTARVEYPELGNHLQLVSRRVFAIVHE